MIKLTVAIITFNEERNIGRCISSVRDIADEILIVDSFSQDQTEAICQNHKVRFVKNKFIGHIEQKNYARELATHDYVLSLDADEALSHELLIEIKAIKENFEYDGYSFNRLTNYSGQWIRHCGWYPDRKLRLIKKDKAKWGGVNPHDLLILHDSSKEQFIPGNLLHYSYTSIASHIQQTNKFTTIAAYEAHARGVRSNTFKIFSRPILKFFRDYFFKLGILDGRYGFIICCINSLSALLKYSKIYELQKGKEI
jgi:glycosyltransferase involved in cell wall biosynthesis